MTNPDISKRYRPTPRPETPADDWLVPSEDWPETPAENRPKVVPNPYVGTVRTMTSPLTAITDRDVRGFPVTTQAGTLAADGFPVDYVAASGATAEHSLSDHLVSLGAHETRVRRSRKGRTTFEVLAYGKAGAPVTDGATGLAGTDAIGLARLADSILRASEGERVVSPAGHVTYGRADVSGEHGTWLLGSTVTAYEAMIHQDRSAQDAFGVCDHHADLFSALGVSDVSERPLVMRRDRNVTGHVPVRFRPVVRSATFGDGVTRRTGSGESRLSWPVRKRVRLSLRKAERAEYVKFTAGTINGVPTSNSVVTYVTPAGELVSAHTDSDLIWHGHQIAVRPVTVARTKGRKTRTTSTVARKGRPKVAPSVTVPTPSADGCWHVATRRGRLTILPAGKSGRHSVTLVTPSGTERWQSRTVAAAIARAQ